MTDFLTFKTFISIDILILSYYIGAIIIPIVIWLSKGYLQKKFKILDKLNNSLLNLFGTMSLTKKLLSVLLFLFMFMSMEIVWRMCFEAMIGYFQIIESLKQGV